MSKNSKVKRKVSFKKFVQSFEELDQIKIAQAIDESNTQKSFEELLLNMNIVNEAQLAELLSIYTDIEIISLQNIHIDEKLASLIPKEYAQKNQIFPIKRLQQSIQIAFFNPLSKSLLNDIRMMTQLKVIPYIAGRQEIQNAIFNGYPKMRELESLMSNNLSVNTEPEIPLSLTKEDDAPVVKIVNSIIEDAVDRRASDIHFDPQEDRLIVRIRVDGLLSELMQLDKNIQGMIVSRIKVMSELDIAETRLPQDGKTRIRTGNRRLDLRVSCLPTVHGEKIVIRVSDLSMGIRSLEQLSLSDKNYRKIKNSVYAPHGLVLVTGPTGSGKSSTLYSILNEVNTTETNIITVEDPVEQQIEGINQVQVNQSIGLTFAAGLRTILRQDPNVIMVGEIRDAETAEMAIRASMTGHLVLSTLHTNNAVDTVIRLIDMGVDSFLVATSLSVVIAQRLVRRVCSACAKKVPVKENEKKLLNNYNLDADFFVEGDGCSVCNNTGYSGRIPIHEVLEVNPEISKKIISHNSSESLKESAAANGMVSMFRDGLNKVIEGQTTLKELYQVVEEG